MKQQSTSLLVIEERVACKKEVREAVSNENKGTFLHYKEQAKAGDKEKWSNKP